MRRLSLSRLVIVVLPLLVGVTWLSGCSTEPVNVEGCRSIENARCEAAGACPNFPNFDVDGCKRFYHDQCLHGLSSSEDPGQPNIEACVQAINQAGACAKQNQTPCEIAYESTPVDSPCNLIEHPEKYVACAFLVPPAPAPDAAAEATVEAATEGGDDAPADAGAE